MVVSADPAAFGKRVGAALGYDTSLPGDWAGYGRAAEYAIGHKQPPPDPARFGILEPPPPPPPVYASQGREPVRVGAFEINLDERPRAPYRMQHHKRRGERTSGRYRLIGRPLPRPAWCGRPR